MKTRKIKFSVYAIRWFDKINGNTYHSTKIIRTKDSKVIISNAMVYGYEDCYKQTALDVMLNAAWLPKAYKNNLYMYERENNYPIAWRVVDGLKLDMINNVIL